MVGSRDVSMLLQRKRWTWVSLSGNMICRNIFEMSPENATGSTRKRSKTPKRFPIRHGPLYKNEFSETPL